MLSHVVSHAQVDISQSLRGLCTEPCRCHLQGPEVGEVLTLLTLDDGDVSEQGALVPLPQRMETLRAWLAEAQQSTVEA